VTVDFATAQVKEGVTVIVVLAVPAEVVLQLTVCSTPQVAFAVMAVAFCTVEIAAAMFGVQVMPVVTELVPQVTVGILLEDRVVPVIIV